MTSPASKVAKGAGAIAIAAVIVSAAEGLVLSTYPDVGGVPTDCYGETKDAEWGKTYTKEQCDAQLSERLVEFNEGVNSCVTLNFLIRAGLRWFLWRTTLVFLPLQINRHPKAASWGCTRRRAMRC